MKWVSIFITLQIIANPLLCQCDSLETLSRSRGENFNRIGLYEDQIKYLSESVNLFINCDYYDEAISWQLSKVTFASLNSKIEDQKLFTHESELLLKKYESDISEQAFLNYKLKVTHFWFDFYHKTGNHSKSIVFLESIEKLSESEIDLLSEDSKKNMQKIFLDQAREYSRKKEHNLAIEYLNETLKYVLARDNRMAKISNETLVYGLISEIYLRIRDLKNAKIYCGKHVIKSAELVEINPMFKTHYITALRRLTEWHILNNSLDSASYFINKAFLTEERLKSDSYSSKILLARILIESHKTDEAREYLLDMINEYGETRLFIGFYGIRKCLEMSKLLILANEFYEAGSLLDYTRNQLNEKISVRQDFDVPFFHSDEGFMLDLFSQQIILLGDENMDSVISIFDNAFAIINNGFQSISTKYDKLLFAKKSLVLTENFLEHLPLADENYHEKAFSAIESSKAVTLFNAWKQKQYYILNNNNEVFSQEQIIEEKLGSVSNKFLLSKDSTKSIILKKEIDHLNHSLDSIKSILKNSHLTYFKMKYDWQNPSVEEVQNALLNNEVYINYFEGENSLYAILISQDNTEIIKIPEMKTVRDLISQYSNLIFKSAENNSTKEISTVSYALYQNLLEPFSDNLNENIIISPSGSLTQIPFAALRKNNDFDPDGLLIMNHSISYTPSASMFFQGRSSTKKQLVKNGLFIAPNFSKNKESKDLIAMRSSLGELIFNVQEVESISSLVKNQTLINENANKSEFLRNLKEADLLHFATHAKSNEDAPDRSFIAFYSDNAEASDTNLLYLDELSKLHMPTKMVVLSACETGLGKIYKGEGAMSLANACFYAGSESVVATLWSVQDKPTHDIIVSFYNYLDKGFAKDEALQKAQLDFIANNPEEFHHPYYWAGFTVIGDNEALVFVKGNPLLKYGSIVLIPLVFITGIFFLRKKGKMISSAA